MSTADLPRRQRFKSAVRDAGLVPGVVHGQLSRPHPAAAGAVRTPATQTQVLPSVRPFLLSSFITPEPEFSVQKDDSGHPCAPRRDQGVSGQPVTITVEGVQVTLPSYEEAVSAGGGTASALSSESRVQIVLSEGQHATVSEADPPRPSALKQLQSDMGALLPLPPSSSPSPPPSSSTWVPEQHAGASSPPSLGSGRHSLALLDSEMDFSDGKSSSSSTLVTPCLTPPLCTDAAFLFCRHAVVKGGLTHAADFVPDCQCCTNLHPDNTQSPLGKHPGGRWRRRWESLL